MILKVNVTNDKLKLKKDSPRDVREEVPKAVRVADRISMQVLEKMEVIMAIKKK